MLPAQWPRGNHGWPLKPQAFLVRDKPVPVRRDIAYEHVVHALIQGFRSYFFFILRHTRHDLKIAYRGAM
jgi:hypothetical protein